MNKIMLLSFKYILFRYIILLISAKLQKREVYMKILRNQVGSFQLIDIHCQSSILPT